MLNQDAVRTVIGDYLEEGTDGLTIYRRGVDGTLNLPAVLIANPAIAEFDVQACGIDRWQWPIHVGVARSGGDEEATQAELQQRMAQVIGLLRQLLDEDPYLGAADVAHARLTSAEFGTSLAVQGQAFPAYEITIEIDG